MGSGLMRKDDGVMYLIYNISIIGIVAMNSPPCITNIIKIILKIKKRVKHNFKKEGYVKVKR
jgi:hypothetical protein